MLQSPENLVEMLLLIRPARSGARNPALREAPSSAALRVARGHACGGVLSRFLFCPHQSECACFSLICPGVVAGYSSYRSLPWSEV